MKNNLNSSMKLLTIATFIFGGLLSSCVSSNSTPDNNTNISSQLVVEQAATIPVLDGKPTSTGIYIRNNSNKEINGISYALAGVTTSKSNLNVSQNECNTIAANSSCLLPLATPSLNVGDSNSNILVASYNGKQTKQLINYSYVDTASYHGVNFSDNSQKLFGTNDHATVYVFVGDSQAQANVGFNVSNHSLAISKGLTNAHVNIGVNQVIPLEIQSNQNVTSRLILVSPDLGTNVQKASSSIINNSQLQVVITPSQQANLLMSTLPVLTQAESVATLSVVNNGNQQASAINLVASDANITVGTATVNPCGSTLDVGASCNYQVSLANSYSNGSSILDLDYNNTQGAATATQTVYYQNNKAEPMVTLVPTQTSYTAQAKTSESIPTPAQNYVTYNVTNLGNAPLNNASITISSKMSESTAFSIRNNNCPATIVANSSPCQVEVTVAPGTSISNGVVYLNLKGDFTGATTKSYSFISKPVYVSIIDTTAATVVSTSPSGSGVSLVSGITINFSEPMSPTTMNNSVWLQDDNGRVVQLELQGVTDNNQVANFILPSGVTLDDFTNYQIMINPSQIEDANGTAMGSGTSESVSSFITGDVTAPTVGSYTPAAGTTNVSAAPEITISFSESMDVSTLTPANFMLKTESGALVTGYTIVYDDTTNTVAFDFNGVILSDFTTYNLTINQSAITDAAGLPMGSNSNYLVTSFTTGDFTAPVIITANTQPVNGSTTLTNDTSISLTFSESMDISTLNTTSVTLFRVSDSSYITLNNPVFSNDNNTVTFTPTESLPIGQYRVIINPSIITDVAGNSISNSTTQTLSTFTTAVPSLFVWQSGSNLTNQVAKYGTKGVASLNNDPGNRISSNVWADGSHMWLFGGTSVESIGNGRFNDLWKYNFNSHEWTWVSGSNQAAQGGVYGTKGVPSVNNIPGGRSSSASWSDESGNLWMFGGSGKVVSGGNDVGLNDLWRYSPTTDEWTWVSGSNQANQIGVYGTKGVPSVNNIPGSKSSASFWVDKNGNFWLFSGYGSSPGETNDLWKYDISTNEWTWVSGESDYTKAIGVYGTKGVASINNIPPGRQSSTYNWVDESNNLWLFGGRGASSSTYLSDLWKYDISTNEWTWVGGSNQANQIGVYGTKGVPSVNNIPGGRYGAMAWIDHLGNIWLFGGTGYPNSSSRGFLNDLWKYNPTTNEWMWVNGSNVANQTGVYGTKDKFGINNIPSARAYGSMAVTNESGNLYLFGGIQSGSGMLNDLWVYFLE